MSSSVDMELFRQRLLGRRSELVKLQGDSEQSRQAVELDQTSVGRVSRIDAIQVQAMALAMDRQREGELSRIAAALQRINDGTYGECVSCGEDIAIRRLEVDASTPVCVTCADKRR